MDFTCQRCGKCCKEIGIPWSELDVHLVAAHLHMELDDFLDLYGFQGNEHSDEIEPMVLGVTPCPFLKYDKEKAICKIYPVRPWVCKGYPGPNIICRAGLERGQGSRKGD
jgi:Fe-S-cluster containining protein